MTIIDGSRALFDFFKDEDVFNLNKDFKRVVLISLDEKIDKEIIKKALKSFEDQGLIAPLSNDNWVLTKPLVEYNQTLELSFNTVHAIATTINAICDNLGVEKGKVDPMRLTEDDIQNLVMMVHNLKDNTENNDE